MDLTRWLLFLAMTTLMSLTPGPAVMFVMSHGLRGGVRRALWPIGGILSANMLFCALTATGIGVLNAASHQLFEVIRWAGGAYLAYLGLAAWRAGPFAMDDLGAPAPPGDRRAAVQGFTSQFANPKALLYFSAILPTFVAPSHPIAPQMVIFGLTDLVSESLILIGYAALASRARVLANHPAFARWSGRLAGILLLAAGVSVAASGHS